MASLWLCLATLFCLLVARSAGQTEIGLPPLDGDLLDIYFDKQNDVALLLTEEYLYQFNFDLNLLADQVSLTTFNRGVKIYSEIVEYQGRNYVYVLAETTNGLNGLHRFQATSIWSKKAAALSFNEFPDPGEELAMAIDPATNVGYIVSQVHPQVVVVDLINMVRTSSFNYRQANPRLEPVIIGYPGGWAIAVDSKNHKLYLGVACWAPTPSYVWQYDIRNPSSVTMTNSTVFSSNACFEDAFVDQTEGRAWFLEDSSGWVGGFSPAGLHFGGGFSVQSNFLIRAMEYDEKHDQAFMIEQSVPYARVQSHSFRSTRGPTPQFAGKVLRVCLLERSPANVEQIYFWNPNDGVPTGSFLAKSTRKLYVSTRDKLFTVHVPVTTPCKSHTG